jgi:hypothetical protein
MCTCHIFFWIWSDFYVEEIFCLLSQWKRNTVGPTDKSGKMTAGPI